MARILQSYFRETRKPIYSAALLLPFFAVYHIGTLFLNTTYINGADALIIRLLSLLSVNSMFASAVVLLACFVIWQVRSRSGWKVDSVKLFLLFVESCFFAVLLFFVFGWLSIRFSNPSAPSGIAGTLERIVLYCGAGIYEELVFRFFLLGMLLFVFSRVFGMKTGPAAAVSVITAALLFSLFHYIGPAADRFTLAGFLQRTFGGLYFSVLFVSRGFGVTAAAHALYDLLVGL